MAPQRSEKVGRAKPYERLNGQASVNSEAEFFNPIDSLQSSPAQTQLPRRGSEPNRSRVLPRSNSGGLVGSKARPKPLQLEDLRALRTIGCNPDTKVVAVKVKREKSLHPLERKNSVMAVKITSTHDVRRAEKGFVYDSDRTHHRNDERRAHWELPWNPFVAGLIDTYSDTKNLYQLKELGVCGTLERLLKTRDVLPADWCRFYFANIVMGLEFLHSYGIMHRDIKPSNIFIGGDGYLMIGDFGSAVHISDEMVKWQQIGTMMYMPPEVNLKNHYSSKIYDLHFIKRTATDWWSAAVILYEMASKAVVVPSNDASMLIYERLIRGEHEWPDNVNADLKDLVDHMLVNDMFKRYGNTLEQVIEDEEAVLRNYEIRDHPFFDDFSWDAAAKRTLMSPYIPSPYPNYTEGWHHEEEMVQKHMPGLKIATPPAHRQWDIRNTKPRISAQDVETEDDSDDDYPLLPA